MAKGTKTLNSAIQVADSKNMFFVINPTEPADADIGPGQWVFWLDASTPPGTIKIKSRNGAVVVAGDVASLSVV